MTKHKARKPEAGHFASAMLRNMRDLLISLGIAHINMPMHDRKGREGELHLDLSPDDQKQFNGIIQREFTDRARRAHLRTGHRRGRPNDTGTIVTREEFTAYYAEHPGATLEQVMDRFPDLLEERAVRRYEQRWNLPRASHKRKKPHRAR